MVSRANARLIAAREAMAAACLAALPSQTLGSVTLRADQRRVVSRAARALAEHGGCLIGEDVGRGKTFIALALATQWRAPLVLAPASLRSTWRVAMDRAALPCAFVTHESLSRRRAPPVAFDGVIVDESHHFRTPATNRYAMLAGIASRARIVLLSATPLQNRARDLAAQVALFHGERAFAIGMQELASFIIRSEEGTVAGMPEVRAPQWLLTGADDSDVLEAILALPPPPTPVDGGDAGALRCIGLVRAWASSRAALAATLRTRRRIATALAQAAEEGRAPTRRETLSWRAAENVVQLGFPALLVTRAAETTALPALLHALERDADATRRLAGLLRSTPDPDNARADAIRHLRAAYAPASIVAFSEYASTVVALFNVLRADAGVGMLTAREARIASGPVTRSDLLARFAHVAQGAPPPRPHERVTLLLATDLLSEGVNLQDASIVLHLDLPWNPARLAQRVGRLRRPGGAKAVSAWLLAPPAGAAALLDAEARLRRKLATAERVMGLGFRVIPALSIAATACLSDSPVSRAHATAGNAGALIGHLEQWRPISASPHTLPTYPVVACVQAQVEGWLAALRDGRVLACVNGVVSTSLRDAVTLAALANGVARDAGIAESREAVGRISDWLAAAQLESICGLKERPGPLQCVVLEWTRMLMRSMRRHERVVVMPLIARLRSRLQQPFPLGTEQSLADHARCAVDACRATEALAQAHQILDTAPQAQVRAEATSTMDSVPAALILFSSAPA